MSKPVSGTSTHSSSPNNILLETSKTPSSYQILPPPTSPAQTPKSLHSYPVGLHHRQHQHKQRNLTTNSTGKTFARSMKSAPTAPSATATPSPRPNPYASSSAPTPPPSQPPSCTNLPSLPVPRVTSASTVSSAMNPSTPPTSPNSTKWKA